MEMVTEAGIIGKIGLNSHGVGCTLNAVKAKGVSFEKIPCHLALRTVLESTSRTAAIASLEKAGVASACHILVADATGGTGLECSSLDIVKIEMQESVVLHTNHYVLPHAEGVVESHDWLVDTTFRLKRIGELIGEAKEKGEGPSVELVEGLLKDEKVQDGAAICRFEGKDSLATLFSIVMDLGAKTASLAVGRPTEAKEIKYLSP
jgi:isopenicillin-N N-acyltransferase-like protein